MAWETRGDHLYHYRSVRENGRVRKRYIGRGEIAELVAHADQTMASVCRGRVTGEWADLEEVRSLLEASDEMGEAVESLARTAMVAAEYHRHKGEWRRRRNA